MIEINIYGENYKGTTDFEKETCRAILIDNDLITLSYLTKKDVFMIPGGELNLYESKNDCVIREIKEELGYIVEIEKELIKINEFYGNYKFINNYYLCKVVGFCKKNLTEDEKELGLERHQMKIDEALKIFSSHDVYKNKAEEKRGIYLREFTVLNFLFKGDK